MSNTLTVNNNRTTFQVTPEGNNVVVDVTQGRPTVTVSTGGSPGPQGPMGPAGIGVPAGGDTGQVLGKVDGTSYNTEWVDQQSGPAGQMSYWMSLARGFSSIPTQIATIATGQVWEYTYINGTLYRFIADDLSEDSFYENWNGAIVSGLVATKQISII